MDEAELDFKEYADELEIEEEPKYVIDESEDDLWEPEPTQKKPVKRRTPKKKIVIPPNAHPIEIFMLTKDFQWGHITGITGLTKDVLVGTIRGDVVAESARQRLRLTTGIVI